MNVNVDIVVVDVHVEGELGMDDYTCIYNIWVVYCFVYLSIWMLTGIEMWIWVCACGCGCRGVVCGCRCG